MHGSATLPFFSRTMARLYPLEGWCKIVVHNVADGREVKASLESIQMAEVRARELNLTENLGSPDLVFKVNIRRVLIIYKPLKRIL